MINVCVVNHYCKTLMSPSDFEVFFKFMIYLRQFTVVSFLNLPSDGYRDGANDWAVLLP